ncbi:MAG TPA: NTP transferase domain-containing protein [Acidimicrobiia bacterium]|nr:NTP transferase domain-containing protein [Acidimicrobiia bacterium]
MVLTGGRSTRMGRDKATIVVDGETWAVRSGRLLAQVCAPVIEVGPGVSGLPAIVEATPGRGPLVAFLAGVDALAATGPVVLLACDMPRLDVALLELVANWPGTGTVVPVVDGHKQHSCSRWSSAAIGRGRNAPDGAIGAMRGDDTVFLEESVWRRVTSAPGLTDADTPEDLARLGLT